MIPGHDLVVDAGALALQAGNDLLLYAKTDGASDTAFKTLVSQVKEGALDRASPVLVLRIPVRRIHLGHPLGCAVPVRAQPGLRPGCRRLRRAGKVTLFGHNRFWPKSSAKSRQTLWMCVPRLRELSNSSRNVGPCSR